MISTSSPNQRSSFVFLTIVHWTHWMPQDWAVTRSPQMVKVPLLQTQYKIHVFQFITTINYNILHILYGSIQNFIICTDCTIGKPVSSDLPQVEYKIHGIFVLHLKIKM